MNSYFYEFVTFHYYHEFNEFYYPDAANVKFTPAAKLNAPPYLIGNETMEFEDHSIGVKCPTLFNLGSELSALCFFTNDY